MSTTTVTRRDPARQIVSLTTAVVASRALQVVAELGVADTIGPDEEAPIATIAARCACHPDALDRALRLLETHGVFTHEANCWSHTDISTLLRSDHPTSLRAYARTIGHGHVWDALTDLAACVRTGQPAPHIATAGGAFAYLLNHPDQLAVFQEAMTAKSHADIAAILDVVDVHPYQTVADIGGGPGQLLRSLLDQCPHLEGTLVDLPDVIETVTPTDRLRLHAADFFTDRLPAANVSMLMHVIHDWDDDHAARILDAVAAANTPGSTVLLFEWILPEHGDTDDVNSIDVVMLAVTGGRERTATDFERLLGRAAYDLVEIRPTATPIHVIEARLSRSAVT